jgi:hypothetical protein
MRRRSVQAASASERQALGVDRLRDSGPGWQSRVNEILKKAVGG